MQLTIWTENVKVCPRFGRFRWLRAYGVLRSSHCSVGFIDDWNDKHGPFFVIKMKCPYLLSLNFKVLNKRITYETLWEMHKWLMQVKGRNLKPWFVDLWFVGTTGLSEADLCKVESTGGGYSRPCLSPSGQLTTGPHSCRPLQSRCQLGA